MWKIIILFYITTGVAIVLLPRVHRRIRMETSDINTRRHPAWKVIGFFSIVYPITILLWPMFIRDLFFGKESSGDLANIIGEGGVDTDEIPGGQGEFGLVASNPIPCKSIYGGITYLASLRTHEGNEVIYERVRTVVSDVTPKPVDVYEISLPDGQKAASLFISRYHKINSKKAPRGFMLI